MLKFNPFKSLTIWGAVGAIASTLVGHFDPAALSPTATTILQSAGTFVSVLGLRNAHAKGVAAVAEAIAQLAAQLAAKR